MGTITDDYISHNQSNRYDFLLDNGDYDSYYDPPLKSPDSKGNSDDFMSDDLKFNVFVKWIAFFTNIWSVIIFINGIIGNSLVIYMILRYTKMKTVTNIYILYLAVTNEIYLLTLPFSFTTTIYGSWAFGIAVCKIYLSILYIHQFTIITLLSALTFDKYIAVCHPGFADKYRKTFFANLVCLMAWVLSAIVMIPLFKYSESNRLSYSDNTLSDIFICELNLPFKMQLYKKVLHRLTLSFNLPVSLILVSYFSVIKKLRTINLNHVSDTEKKEHERSSFLIIKIISVYIVCFLPYSVAYIWMTFETGNHRDRLQFTLAVVGQALQFFNSAVQPFLCILLSDNFKGTYSKAFNCCSCQKSVRIGHVESGTGTTIRLDEGNENMEHSSNIEQNESHV